MQELLDEKLAEQQFITPKDQLGYAEEYITVKSEKEENNELLNFSLSNSIENIEIAIYARTGQIINLDNALWQINKKISVSVKHLMNSHHVNYSMTIKNKKGDRRIIVYMRVGDKWFYTDYFEQDGKFYGTDFIYKMLVKFYNYYFDSDS
ncbi:MAG: hypothetical protein FWD13_10205 [Treponema sp.]|nr:hypothetical protein [Treponema sp.]